jgi:NMD protein affecting ribosome stability and mRNA decay
MKSNKKYSNATFTKRVDHEGGRHHTPHNFAEPLFCEVCGCIFVNRRWVRPEELRARGASNLKAPKPTTCPACVQTREGLPEGYVHLEGPFVLPHREEIERLVANETGRLARRNPLARVIDWATDEKGNLRISTTTTFLARRLGRALEKAFGGTLTYTFSHENRLLRAYWVKD